MRTVLATYSDGKLAPLEPLPLQEGQRVEVTIRAVAGAKEIGDIIRATSGAWADQLDCEEFEQSIHERRHRPRPAPQL